jgi:hypothetical protein
LSFEALAIPALVVLALAGVLLLVSTEWRLSIAVLSFLYVGVFLLVSLSWPVEKAVVKLVAGWMSGAVLGMALIGLPEESRHPMRMSTATSIFRLIIAGLVLLVAFSLGPKVTDWIEEISLFQAYGGAILIGLGLLHLGLTAHPLRVTLGLLTLLAGFEIYYAAMEDSSLVTGLLAGIDLGLALLGAYLISLPVLGEAEEIG